VAAVAEVAVALVEVVAGPADEHTAAFLERRKLLAAGLAGRYHYSCSYYTNPFASSLNVFPRCV